MVETYIVWCRLRHGQTDRQTNGRTDGCHNNHVKNHEADAVQRSICRVIVTRYTSYDDGARCMRATCSRPMERCAVAKNEKRIDNNDVL